MPRRSHKKSRAGCTNCKRRHVKCDEIRPACVSCQTAGRKCSYLSAPLTSTVYTGLQQQPSPASTLPDKDGSNDSTSPSASRIPDTNLVNMDHLELLHYWQTETYKSFSFTPALTHSFMQVAVKLALAHPFLMHQLLAITSLHLSLCRPERSVFYREQASALSTVAVHGLNQVLLEIDTDNCPAIFLFSCLIGRHTLCENFAHRDGNFSNFLDRLLESIRLLQGVRTVLGGGWYEVLKKSELSELVAAGSEFAHRACEPTGPLKLILDLVHSSDIGNAAKDTYEQAIIELQRIMNNIERVQLEGGESISLITIWPIVITTDFTDLMAQRRPEALIILAHFAATLHGRRGSWALGDAGQYLVRSITDYLGHHWNKWLEWPNAVVSSDE